MKPLKINLPDDLRALLERASAKAGRPVAEEIRQRLAHTFAQEAYDPVARELIFGIVNLADSIAADLGGAWHKSPNSHPAFAAAVAQRIAGYRPPGEAIDDGLLMGDAPEAIGRTHERNDQRSRLYEHLKAAQTARSARHVAKKEDKS